MPEFQNPGVFITNVPLGPRPIRAVQTSTAAFAGVSDRGPETPQRVRSLAEFEQVYGTDGTHLHRAARLFFLNGGRDLWIVRTASASARSIAGKAAADPEESTGLAALSHLPDINLVAAPGLHKPGVHAELAAHAEKAGNRIAVLDAPPEAAAVGDIRPALDTDRAALFHPWLVADGEAIPPSGAICGLIARTDASRGVWKAPAGTAAQVRGATGLTVDFTAAQQEVLNPQGVNLLRAVAGGGIVNWGARTLSSDPEWKYVPVRRTALFIETSLTRGLQWAVFEPNGPPLWAAITEMVGAFLSGLFRQGAFPGQTPDEAFFVKCDLNTSMTEADIDLGIVIVEIGFAPVKPAEFVVFRIGQRTADARS